jgi:hypothetical protein
MPSSEYGMTERPEDPEHQADHEHDHSDCPDNWDSRHEPDDEKKYAENNHGTSSDAR